MKRASLFLFTAALLGNVGVLSANDYRMHSTQPTLVLPRPASNPAMIIEPALPEEPCFSYRYVEAGYVYHDSDPIWGDAGHGAGVSFSYDFLGPIYTTGAYNWASGDDATFANADFGLGVYHQLFECFQVNLEAGGAWRKSEIGSVTNDDFGYYVGPGLRTRIKKGVEIFANAHYAQVGETDGMIYNGGFVIDLMPNLFLNLSATINDDAETYLVGIRYVY